MLDKIRLWLLGPTTDELAAVVHNCLWIPMSGKLLRAKLRDCGIRLTAVGFYMRMAALEDRKSVVHYYEEHRETKMKCCWLCGFSHERVNVIKRSMYRRGIILAKAPE